ncbi:MAG: hypothetical protein ACQES9_13580 [Myxococcota bacterium]
MQKEGFYCPLCSTRVSSDDNSLVKLKGKLESDKFSVIVNIDIPATPGKYGAKFPEGVFLEEGAEVEFICPHCNQSLTIEDNPSHSALFMVNEDGKKKIMAFNRTYGKHSSFVFSVDTKKLLASYGEDQNKYVEQFNKDINYFGF